MKGMRIKKMETNTSKKLCDGCRRYFSENELDIYDGKELCSECEQKELNG